MALGFRAVPVTLIGDRTGVVIIRGFDEAALKASLARAFRGMTLAKEAQAAPLKDAFRAHLPEGQSGWVDTRTGEALDQRLIEILQQGSSPTE